MNVEEKIKLISMKPTEEIITLDRLRELLKNKEKVSHYIGYEISGYIHFGTAIGILKVSDFTKAGIYPIIFLADWHSYINEKLGGDMELIRKIAKNYYTKTFEKLIESFGGDPEKVRFILASDVYNDEYWELVLKISKNITLSRAKRSVAIAGRKSSEDMKLSTLFYVAMQAADIFHLGVDIAHGGMEQRKIHVIAIDIGEKIGKYKPIAVHHHIFTSLNVTKEMLKILESAKKGKVDEEALIDIKMSKSNPSTAIFLHDDPETIRKKILMGYCPMKDIKINPVWEIVEWLIFREEPTEFLVENKKTGEVKTYNTYEEIKKDYEEGKLHPLDLKEAVANYIIEMFEDVGKWLREGSGRKYLEEMKEVQITR